MKAREISESKQWTIEITRKNLRENLIPIISSIICHIGGILFILSTVQIVGAIEAFYFGVIVLIGSFIGLKYHRGGFLLCLCFGIISLLICQVPILPFLEPCINLSPGFFYGTIFTIIGSAVGLIGGILKGRKQKTEHKNDQLKAIFKLKANLNRSFIKNWKIKLEENSESEFDYFMHFYQKLSIIGSILCYFGGFLFFLLNCRITTNSGWLGRLAHGYLLWCYGDNWSYSWIEIPKRRTFTMPYYSVTLFIDMPGIISHSPLLPKSNFPLRDLFIDISFCVYFYNTWQYRWFHRRDAKNKNARKN
ncbi:MAG: hypothetical protein ACFFCI_14970 [Promethearchaeota archaeon]